MPARHALAAAALLATLALPTMLSPSAAWAGPGGDPACIHDPGGCSSERNYQVQRGDWLWKIARMNLAAHGVGTKDLRVVKRHADAIYAVNRGVIGKNPSRIRPGMRLVLPRP